MTVVIILLVLLAAWLLALEIRYHGVKALAAESKHQLDDLVDPLRRLGK